jgi:hypothetical protein
VIDFKIVVALQIFDTIQATTLFEVKGNFLQFAHFLGSGKNISQAIQHDQILGL